MSDIAVRILSFLRLVRRYWLSLAVAATVLHLIGVHLAPNSAFRRTLFKVTNSSQEFGRYTTTDRLFNEAAGNSNVFLSFLDSDSIEPKTFNGDVDPIRLRGVYTMYPRRIFLGPPEILAAAGYDSQKIKFEPDMPWLKANHIASVIVCRFDKNTHRISCDIVRVE